MIRNHLINDPEASPSPPVYSKGAYPAYRVQSSDDPWYTSSSSVSNSPTSSEGKGSFFDNGQSYYSSSYDNNDISSKGYYNTNTDLSSNHAYGHAIDDGEDDLPLLEELGINFDHIYMKTQAVLYPTKKLSAHILDDTDLAGPIFFCLLLGSLLLLSGKVQFGYIFGFSVFGCMSLQVIVNLIHPSGLDFWRTCSVLGYCLLPVIVLAAFSILINLKGLLGIMLSAVAISWSTISATRLIDAKLQLQDLYWLTAYPIMLLYSCFVIITVF